MVKKSILTTIVVATVFLLPLDVANSGERHGAKALEHAAVAASHSEKGHLELISRHSREALYHAKMASQEHHEKHMHMEKL